jgi:hypothetical protein
MSAVNVIGGVVAVLLAASWSPRYSRANSNSVTGPTESPLLDREL